MLIDGNEGMKFCYKCGMFGGLHYCHCPSYVSPTQTNLKEMIAHMWKNSHLSNLGYDSMSEKQKELFHSIVGKPTGDRNV